MNFLKMKFTLVALLTIFSIQAKDKVLIGVEGACAPYYKNNEGIEKEIIKEATRLGMTTGIVVNPFQYPKEFKTALEGSVDARGLNDLTIRPGANQSFDDGQLQLLAKAKIRAYLHTYTDVDYIYITMPEFPEAQRLSKTSWLN